LAGDGLSDSTTMTNRGADVARSNERGRVTRRNSVGMATRERIMITAERLFAERGILGPSLEEIGLATGQRNKTVIQYYFGDREGLIGAIVDYRAASTQGMRAQMLGDMIAEGREPDVRSLVSTIVTPVARQLVPGNHYAGFLAQLTLTRGPFGRGDELATVYEALRRLLPELPVELFDLRWAIALDTNVFTLAHVQQQMERGTLALPLDVRVADLIEVIAGVFRAPAPTRPN
jgi:AcrR family transcriptional regulator